MTTFADDRTSGASDVALAFLADLEAWAATDLSGTAAAFRVALLGWLRDAQQAGIGQFAQTRILLHTLAHFCRIAIDIQDIIRNLEG